MQIDSFTPPDGQPADLPRPGALAACARLPDGFAVLRFGARCHANAREGGAGTQAKATHIDAI